MRWWLKNLVDVAALVEQRGFDRTLSFRLQDGLQRLDFESLVVLLLLSAGIVSTES